MTDFPKPAASPRERHKPSGMEKVADTLDISKDFLAGSVKVTILGTTEITAEGALSIIEYTDNSLKLNTKNFILSIDGINLEISELDSDYLKVRGDITSVKYI